MTNEEAIAKLTNIMHDDIYSWHPSILEAFRMAVDALRGADGDCISRQAAIDALHMHLMYRMGTDSNKKRLDEWINNLPSAHPSFPQRHENDAISRQAAILHFVKTSKNYECRMLDLKEITHELWQIPSAQPEQRWIPVSEGLPKEYGEYICTMENGQVQECGFVPENQRGLVDGWSTCEADGHKFLGYADVLAWMPLPEPWKEGEAE